jgi:hypothetical protein
MSTKLTLTIEESVIENAKQYARQKGTSLSNMVENYLKIVATESVCAEPELSPIVKSLKGSFKTPADFNYKRELSKGLSKKYLEDEKYTD